MLTQHDGHRATATGKPSGLHDREQLGLLLPVVAPIRKRAEEVDGLSGGLLLQPSRSRGSVRSILFQAFNTCSMTRCSSTRMSVALIGNVLLQFCGDGDDWLVPATAVVWAWCLLVLVVSNDSILYGSGPVRPKQEALGWGPGLGAASEWRASQNLMSSTSGGDIPSSISFIFLNPPTAHPCSASARANASRMPMGRIEEDMKCRRITDDGRIPQALDKMPSHSGPRRRHKSQPEA